MHACMYVRIYACECECLPIEMRPQGGKGNQAEGVSDSMGAMDVLKEIICAGKEETSTKQPHFQRVKTETSAYLRHTTALLHMLRGFRSRRRDSTWL
jgi:hypothetical protein